MAITSTATHLVISFICFVPVEPKLVKVAGTQFVLFNQTSSLWCPAQGAPAPFIVWRKNGRVVQNSTSVKYQLTITEENTDEYSCEVNGQDDVDKKEIRFVTESEFFHKRIKGGKFLKKLWCFVGRVYYKMIWFCSSQSETFRPDEGLTLQKSALENLYGGKFSLPTQLIKLNYQFTYN